MIKFDIKINLFSKTKQRKKNSIELYEQVKNIHLFCRDNELQVQLILRLD